MFLLENAERIWVYCGDKKVAYDFNLCPDVDHGKVRVERKPCLVCRNSFCRHLPLGIVAMAFIPNPEGKPQVNHRDENPENALAAALWSGNSATAFIVWGSCIMGVLLPFFAAARAVRLP